MRAGFGRSQAGRRFGAETTGNNYQPTCLTGGDSCWRFGARRLLQSDGRAASPDRARGTAETRWTAAGTEEIRVRKPLASPTANGGTFAAENSGPTLMAELRRHFHDRLGQVETELLAMDRVARGLLARSLDALHQSDLAFAVIDGDEEVDATRQWDRAADPGTVRPGDSRGVRPAAPHDHAPPGSAPGAGRRHRHQHREDCGG